MKLLQKALMPVVEKGVMLCPEFTKNLSHVVSIVRILFHIGGKELIPCGGFSRTIQLDIALRGICQCLFRTDLYLRAVHWIGSDKKMKITFLDGTDKYFSDVWGISTTEGWLKFYTGSNMAGAHNPIRAHGYPMCNIRCWENP